MADVKGTATPWPGIEGAPPCLWEGYGPRYVERLAQLTMACTDWIMASLRARRVRMDRAQAELALVVALPHFASIAEHYGDGCLLVEVSHANLARVTGLSKSTVYDALADLTAPGGPLTKVYNSRSRHRTSAYVYTAELGDAPGRADQPGEPAGGSRRAAEEPPAPLALVGRDDSPPDAATRAGSPNGADVRALVSRLSESLAYA